MNGLSFLSYICIAVGLGVEVLVGLNALGYYHKTDSPAIYRDIGTPSGPLIQ